MCTVSILTRYSQLWAVYSSIESLLSKVYAECFREINPVCNVYYSKSAAGSKPKTHSVLLADEEGKRAVRLANTLYNPFTKKIVGKPYVSAGEGANPSGNETRKRKRVGLPLADSEYIWGARERLPETRPGGPSIRDHLGFPPHPDRPRTADD
jgi:hypothetical protein